MSKNINPQEAMEVEALLSQNRMVPSNGEVVDATSVLPGVATHPSRMPFGPQLSQMRPSQAFMAEAAKAREELEQMQAKGEKAADREIEKLTQKGMTIKKGDKIRLVRLNDKDYRVVDINEEIKAKPARKKRVAKKKKTPIKKTTRKMKSPIKTKPKKVQAKAKKKPGPKPGRKVAAKTRKTRKLLKVAAARKKQVRRGPGRPRKNSK